MRLWLIERFVFQIGEVRKLYFFSCSHFCEKPLELKKKKKEKTVYDHLPFDSQQTSFCISECCSLLIAAGVRSQSHRVPVSV